MTAIDGNDELRNLARPGTWDIRTIRNVDSFRNSLRTRLGQNGTTEMSTALILRLLIDQHLIKLRLATLIR